MKLIYLLPLFTLLFIPQVFAQVEYDTTTPVTNSTGTFDVPAFTDSTGIVYPWYEDPIYQTIPTADNNYIDPSLPVFFETEQGDSVTYLLTENSNMVQIEFSDGKIVFDKNVGATTLFKNDLQVVNSDSYLVRTAEVGTDTWNFLQVNDSPVETIVDEQEDIVTITFRKQNNEGIFDVEYIISGEIKTTAKFTNFIYPNHKFAFTETMNLSDNIVLLNGQEIDLNQFIGQTFPREVLDQFEEMIILTQGMYYDSGIGFDNLWSVGIFEDNKIALDYANVQETQTPIGETVELDPTWNGYSTVSYHVTHGSQTNTWKVWRKLGTGGWSVVQSGWGVRDYFAGQYTASAMFVHATQHSPLVFASAYGSWGYSTSCLFHNGGYGCYQKDYVSPPSTIPSAPQSLSIDTQDVANEITLNWLVPSDDGGGIDNYKIYLGGSLIATTGNVLTYDDTISGSEIGSSLVYTVKASNSAGDSTASSSASITSWDLPSQVGTVTGTSGTNPALSWSAPSSDDAITNYKIYRGGALHDTISASPTTYSDSTSIVSGSTYAYTVSAVSDVGEGSQSASVNVVAGVPPDPPTGVSATIPDTATAPLDVTVSFSPSATTGTGTVTGFQLLRDGVAVATDGLVTSLDDTAPSGGTTYAYTVKALGTHGNSVASASSSVTTPNTPAQVTGLTVTPVSTSRIDLSWNTPSDNNSLISGYKVQISSNGGSSYTDVLTGNVNTVYQALSLNGNAQYHFKVSAINGVGTGTASAVSNTYTMTTTPASLSVTPVSEVQINLSWGASTGASGYKIEYESPTGDGFTTLVTNTGTVGTTYSASGLTTSTQYNFKVSGWNNGGTSVASPEASSYTWGILQAPVLDTITRLSPTSLKLDFTAGTGLPVATGYKIERQTGSGWIELIADTGNTDVTYTDSVLSSDQTASYRLYAINTIGTSPVSNEKSSDAVASSGGGGGGSSSKAVSSQTGVSGLIDLTFIDQIHRVVLGQFLSKSINVAWDSSDNLEVKSIIVSDSPFRIVFQDVPFVLIGDPSGISNGKINYSVQIPSELCTQQGQLNCVEQKQYEIPVEIQSVHKGSTLTKSSVIKIDLAGGSDIPLIFVLLAIGAVPVAFILRKVGKGSSRRKASGSSHKSSKNGSNSKKVSL